MNRNILKYIKRGVVVLASLYVVIAALLYFFQEKLLFHPEKTPESVSYFYEGDFMEENYTVAEGIRLNTLLFRGNFLLKKDKLVFYIHGNAENMRTAGGFAPTFTNLGFDCFIYDFRGYGKSDGTISSEEELFADAQILFDEMKEVYGEENIIIVGYSIGTGIASWLASKNSPNKLILQAPYFSMIDMMRDQYPIFPTFLLRYPLENDQHLQQTSCPIHIFHGTKDQVIPHSSSKRLQRLIPKIEFTSLKGLGHTGYMENEAYRDKLRDILWKSDDY